MIMRTCKQLKDAMVQLYGTKSKVVIDFCELCDKWAENDQDIYILNTIVKAHEANPFTAEQLEALG